MKPQVKFFCHSMVDQNSQQVEQLQLACMRFCKLNDINVTPVALNAILYLPLFKIFIQGLTGTSVYYLDGTKNINTKGSTEWYHV